MRIGGDGSPHPRGHRCGAHGEPVTALPTGGQVGLSACHQYLPAGADPEPAHRHIGGEIGGLPSEGRFEEGLDHAATNSRRTMVRAHHPPRVFEPDFTRRG